MMSKNYANLKQLYQSTTRKMYNTSQKYIKLPFYYSIKVMSDEFNVENRTFTDGDDKVWTALDKSDDDASSVGGGSMHFYNSTNVKTEKGFLKISTFLKKS